MGTPGRWRVGANPSVGKEEKTRSPKGQALEWSHPGLRHTAVWVGPRPQRTPNPGTGWDETLTELIQMDWSLEWAVENEGGEIHRQAGGAFSLGVRAVGKVICGDD